MVRVENEFYDIEELPFGSPQGSCLSPLLFIILLADINDWVDNATLYGFADDTSSVVKSNSLKKCPRNCRRGGRKGVFIHGI